MTLVIWHMQLGSPQLPLVRPSSGGMLKEGSVVRAYPQYLHTNTLPWGYISFSGMLPITESNSSPNSDCICDYSLGLRKHA